MSIKNLVKKLANNILKMISYLIFLVCMFFNIINVYAQNNSSSTDTLYTDLLGVNECFNLSYNLRNLANIIFEQACDYKEIERVRSCCNDANNEVFESLKEQLEMRIENFKYYKDLYKNYCDGKFNSNSTCISEGFEKTKNLLNKLKNEVKIDDFAKVHCEKVLENYNNCSGCAQVVTRNKLEVVNDCCPDLTDDAVEMQVDLDVEDINAEVALEEEIAQYDLTTKDALEAFFKNNVQLGLNVPRKENQSINEAVVEAKYKYIASKGYREFTNDHFELAKELGAHNYAAGEFEGFVELMIYHDTKASNENKFLVHYYTSAPKNPGVVIDTEPFKKIEHVDNFFNNYEEKLKAIKERLSSRRGASEADIALLYILKTYPKYFFLDNSRIKKIFSKEDAENFFRAKTTPSLRANNEVEGQLLHEYNKDVWTSLGMDGYNGAFYNYLAYHAKANPDTLEIPVYGAIWKAADSIITGYEKRTESGEEAGRWKNYTKGLGYGALAVLDYYFVKDVIRTGTKLFTKQLGLTYKEFLLAKTPIQAIEKLRKIRGLTKLAQKMVTFCKKFGINVQVLEKYVQNSKEIHELAAALVKDGITSKKEAMEVAKIMKNEGFGVINGKLVQINEFVRPVNVSNDAFDIYRSGLPVTSVLSNASNSCAVVIEYNGHMAIMIRDGKMLTMYDLKGGVFTKLDFSKLDKIDDLYQKLIEQNTQLENFIRADSFLRNNKIQGMYLIDPNLVTGDLATADKLANNIKSLATMLEEAYIPYKDQKALVRIMADSLEDGNYVKMAPFARKYPKQMNILVDYDRSCADPINYFLEKSGIVNSEFSSVSRMSHIRTFYELSNTKGVRIFPAPRVLVKGQITWDTKVYSELKNIGLEERFLYTTDGRGLFYDTIVNDLTGWKLNRKTAAFLKQDFNQWGGMSRIMHPYLYNVEQYGSLTYGASRYIPKWYSIISKGLNILESKEEDWDPNISHNPQFLYSEFLEGYQCIDDVKENKAIEDFMTLKESCDVDEDSSK